MVLGQTNMGKLKYKYMFTVTLCSAVHFAQGPVNSILHAGESSLLYPFLLSMVTSVMARLKGSSGQITIVKILARSSIAIIIKFLSLIFLKSLLFLTYPILSL
jgi:hypothetical protein